MDLDFDAEAHLSAAERTVSWEQRDGQLVRLVTPARSFDTTIDDLWDAVTNAERIPRWFTGVSGDLRLGGRFQLEGNASGEITACEPPSHLALTWEFQGTSWVELRLSVDAAGRARLAVTHIAPDSPFWEQYLAGAAGVGWEMALAGLACYLADPDFEKPGDEAFAKSPAGRAYFTGSSEAWGRAAVAAGADADAARAAVARTTAFYTGQPAPE